jgi:hypothetical protein
MLNRTLLVAGLAGALTAQTPPCISLNDANTTVGAAITAFGFGGPGVNAYQFIPATTLVLQAAQIFTASTPFATPRGYQTLEIWDNNLIGLPQTRLGGGTWQNQPTTPLAAAWQGASFDALVVLQANQVYWLVWRESGGNLLPYEPGGTPAVTARLSGSTWLLQANGQAIKWRGFCSLLDAAYVQAVGLGCMATTGRIPSAFTNNAPTIGNADFQFEASGFFPGTIGIAVLGINPSWVGVPLTIAQPGCVVYADPQVLLTVPVGTGNEQALQSTGCAGHCWIDMPIPSNPALAGIVIDAQLGAIDVASTAPLPLVLTNGVRVTLY